MGGFVGGGMQMREDLSVGQPKFPSIQGGFGNGTESMNHNYQQLPFLQIHVGTKVPATSLDYVDATQLGDSFDIFDLNHDVEFNCELPHEVCLWVLTAGQ